MTQQRHANPSRGNAASRRVEGREARVRWAGTLILASGILLMAPAFAGALASRVDGSEGGEVLRGSDGDERISGLDGEDELYGGGGPDELFSGAGDDFVEASDGGRDTVSCGPGEDVASVDFVDLVADDCERVYPG